MIHIITADNRHLFHHALAEMHRQRKQVFMDELGWPLDEIAGMELDRFDCPEAIYLIETKPCGAITGSARLLPTTRPHLLSDVFPNLCNAPVPSGADVWEATRFCPAPEIAKGAPRRALLMRIIAAIIETALLFGIDRVTFVASRALTPLATQAGWRVTALGAAQRVGRDRLQAFVAEIDAAGLKAVRALNCIDGPLTRFLPAGPARAA